MSDSTGYSTSGSGPHSTLAGNVLDPNVSADGRMSGSNQGVGGTSESNIKREGLEHIKQNTSGLGEGATGGYGGTGSGLTGGSSSGLTGGSSSEYPSTTTGSGYDSTTGTTGQQQGGIMGGIKNMLGMGGASSTSQEPGLSSGSTYDNAGTATDPSTTGSAGGYTGVSQGLGGVNPTSSSTRDNEPSLGRDALAAGGLTGAGAGAAGASSLNDRTSGGYQEDPSVSREGFGNSSTGGLSGPRDGYSGTNPDIGRDSTLGGTTGTDPSLGRDSTLGGSSGMTGTDSSLGRDSTLGGSSGMTGTDSSLGRDSTLGSTRGTSDNNSSLGRDAEYAAGGAGLGAAAGAAGSGLDGSRTNATGNEPNARDTELRQKDAHATGDPEDMQETTNIGDKEGAAQSEKKGTGDAHASTRENPSSIPTAGGERLGEKHWGESKVVPDNPKPRESTAGISSGDGQPTSQVRDNTNANTGSASDPHGSKSSGEKEGLVDKIKDKLHMGH